MPKNKSLEKEWEFFQGYDSPGFDILRSKKRNLSHLVSLCKENGAVGFNTNGWIKKEIKPKKEWHFWSEQKKDGLYIKKSLLTKWAKNNKIKPKLTKSKPKNKIPLKPLIPLKKKKKVKKVKKKKKVKKVKKVEDTKSFTPEEKTDDLPKKMIKSIGKQIESIQKTEREMTLFLEQINRERAESLLKDGLEGRLDSIPLEEDKETKFLKVVKEVKDTNELKDIKEEKECIVID